MNNGISKWIVVTSGIVLALFALHNYSLLEYVLGMDSTLITPAILVIFAIAHFVVLKLVTSPSETLELRLWFAAEMLIAIGMIGTVVGFTMLFGEAFSNIDVEDTASIAAVLVDIAQGMGTALITTLTGLICSLILKGELVFVVGRK